MDQFFVIDVDGHVVEPLSISPPVRRAAVAGPAAMSGRVCETIRLVIEPGVCQVILAQGEDSR